MTFGFESSLMDMELAVGCVSGPVGELDKVAYLRHPAAQVRHCIALELDLSDRSH